MFSEYTTEYEDSSITAATQSMEYAIRSVDTVTEYIDSIQEAYRQQPDGDVELRRMVHAAQLVADCAPDQLSTKAQTIYYGELLGIELINTLTADTGVLFKTGFAQRFMRTRLEADRPVHRQFETTAERLMRRMKMAHTLQSDLTSPTGPYILAPQFERFGGSVVSRLTEDQEQQEYAMMGYRLIVTEALSPSVLETTHEKRDLVRDIGNKALSSGASIFDLEKSYIPSDAELEDIVSEPDDLEWKPIPFVPETLSHKYYNGETTVHYAPGALVQTKASIDFEIQQSLNEFNEYYGLLETDDLIRVKGDLYARFNKQNGDVALRKFTPSSELRGTFDSIQLVEAPSNRSLQNQLVEPQLNRIGANKRLLQTVAIRLKNPIELYRLKRGGKVLYHHLGETIDIPLHYSDVAFSRLQVEDLENSF